ncbi:tyrosine-type recombinase/integrase [Chloroflexota bacterium]
MAMNLMQAAAAYAVVARAEGRSERTVEWITSAARYFGRFLGERAADISTIDATCLRQFILTLRKQPVFTYHPGNMARDRTISMETIACYVRAVKSLFSFLFREEYLADNPMAKVRTPKAPLKEMPVMSVDEIERLIAQADKKTFNGYRNYTMMLAMLDTGIRVSEMCNLTTDDVRLEDGFFRIMGKGGRERFVPFGLKLTKVLLKYQLNCRPKNMAGNYYFTTKDGSRLNRNRVAKIIRDYRVQAGLSGKRVSPHTFRSTKAVLFLRNGGDPFSLQKILGHSTLTMTRRYSAIADTDVKAAHMKFGVVDRLKI